MSKHNQISAILAILLFGLAAIGQQSPDPKPGEVDSPPQPARIGYPNDPAARKFLREAEERGASWNGFPGFTADLTVFRDGKTHRGEVVIPANRKIKLELGDADARKWALEVLLSIATTSSRKDFEERYQNVGVVFGKDDLHPQGQLVELRGDPYQSKFRILDNEIRAIERVTPEHRIALTILSIERDQQDRKRARTFVVNYLDAKSGDLVRSEAIHDERVIAAGYVVPKSWTETVISSKSSQTNALELSNHQILPKVGNETSGRRRQ